MCTEINYCLKFEYVVIPACNIRFVFGKYVYCTLVCSQIRLLNNTFFSARNFLLFLYISI